jgi:uncharacterized protein YcfJ
MLRGSLGSLFGKARIRNLIQETFMNAILRNALVVAGLVIATQASAQVTFYERQGFAGQSFTTERRVDNFTRYGFHDRASSVDVIGDHWEVCDDARLRGNCVVLRPGRYASLAAMGLNDRISSARAVNRNARIADHRYAPLPVVIRDNGPAAEITFFEREGFSGRSFTTEEQISNFVRYGFNDRASSVMVLGGRWEVCEDVRFDGRCVVLRPGRYPSLAAMGLNDRVSSVRSVGGEARVDERRYAPDPAANDEFRRRDNERLYEADVTSVHAVVGPPEQRCWVEREQVVQERRNNVPGAIAGAVIGGILGHQVGGGRGQDLATAGGAVAGAFVGNTVGGGQQVSTQNVQRCANVASQAKPSFWDVTYTFRGQENRVQMTTPPGATVTVNERGEPRS